MIYAAALIIINVERNEIRLEKSNKKIMKNKMESLKKKQMYERHYNGANESHNRGSGCSCTFIYSK